MDNMIVLSATFEEIQKNILCLRSRTMKHFGLGISDMACLMNIKKAGGMTSTELSRSCRVDKALVSRSVKKLLDQDIITYERPRMPVSEAASRVNVKTHRRGAYRVKLVLTEYGEKLTRHFYDVSMLAASEATAGLPREEMSAFLATLQRIRDNFKEYMDRLGEELPLESGAVACSMQKK